MALEHGNVNDLLQVGELLKVMIDVSVLIPYLWKKTIWIDEVADENGRFALITSRFDISK